jgi:GT2 family glycosyltransferase
MDENLTIAKVSIIIVSWNSAGDLRRCLASVDRSFGRENIEVIVVDNGSRDESPQLDSEFPNINLLRLPRNFGMVKALNMGMKTATGDLFFFLQPEVELMPETVNDLVSRLETSADATAVCPTVVNPEGLVLSGFRALPSPEELCRAWRDEDFTDWRTPIAASDCVVVDYVKNSPMMARAQFLRGMHYIDERYGNSWWDLELCYQIRHAGKKILLLPDVKVLIHPGRQDAGAGAMSARSRALLSADRALSAAVFVRKHFGLAAGLKFRFAVTWRAFLRAIASLAGFRNVSHHVSLFGYLLSGQKLDGTQSLF